MLTKCAVYKQLLTECAVHKADVKNMQYIRQLLTECSVHKAAVVFTTDISHKTVVSPCCYDTVRVCCRLTGSSLVCVHCRKCETRWARNTVASAVGLGPSVNSCRLYRTFCQRLFYVLYVMLTSALYTYVNICLTNCMLY
jgi:hypothetical protein